MEIPQIRSFGRSQWLLAAVMLAAGIAVAIHPRSGPCCSDLVEVSIGNHSSTAQGQQASLQRLALELERCPRARKFRILRNESGWNWFYPERAQLTFYDRSTGFLQDGYPLFGASTQWLRVTDRAIQRVAGTSGRFDDLAEYGCQYAMP